MTAASPGSRSRLVRDPAASPTSAPPQGLRGRLEKEAATSRGSRSSTPAIGGGVDARTARRGRWRAAGVPLIKRLSPGLDGKALVNAELRRARLRHGSSTTERLVRVGHGRRLSLTGGAAPPARDTGARTARRVAQSHGRVATDASRRSSAPRPRARRRPAVPVTPIQRRRSCSRSSASRRRSARIRQAVSWWRRFGRDPGGSGSPQPSQMRCSTGIEQTVTPQRPSAVLQRRASSSPG